MLIPQVVLMAFLLCHGMSANIKMDVKVYKWDEKIQICLSDFNILANVICTNDRVSDPSIMRRVLRSLETHFNLYTECCKNMCTPLDILTTYCQHPERMDVKKDLKVYTMSSDPGTTSTTTTTPNPRNFSLSKLTFCSFGVTEYCNDGLTLKKHFGSLLAAIRMIG